MIFQPWVESFTFIKMRFKFLWKTLQLFFLSYGFDIPSLHQYFGVFRWCSWAFCWCWERVVPPMFRGIPLFHQCYVFVTYSAVTYFVIFMVFQCSPGVPCYVVLCFSVLIFTLPHFAGSPLSWTVSWEIYISIRWAIYGYSTSVS